MEPIDREKFGEYLAKLRKEKGLTQQSLADKLYVSNKAVSKWERGQSLPDIQLLTPLAQCLGTTVASLLKGEPIEEEQMSTAEAASLVEQAIEFSAGDAAKNSRRQRFWRIAWCIAGLLAAVETALLWRSGLPWWELADTVLLVEVLSLFFGFWACFLAKDRLPRYYDENKINFYSQGVFRMNIPGIHFNNRNWPHVLTVMRIWMVATSVLFPALYGLLSRVFTNDIWKLPVTLAAALGFFVPIIVAGRRYE